MLRLTDAFIWEDLPCTDPETGSLSMAAWISRVQRVSLFIASVAITFHMIESSIRLLTSEGRSLLYETWYPFDVTQSPFYELTNITQVRNSDSSEVIIYCFFFTWSRIRFPLGEDNVISDICASEMIYVSCHWVITCFVEL
jgi:hypothetical protein